MLNRHDSIYPSEKQILIFADVRKAEIISVTDLKGKPAKENQLEEMDPELQKLYEELLNTV